MAKGRSRAVESARQISRAPSILGWSGIYLETPEGWDLRQVAGDMQQGNLRVDGPDDGHIRVKWKKQKGTVDTSRILDRYLATIRKAAKKKGHGFESSLDVQLRLPAEISRRKPLLYRWRTDFQGLGMIWHCPDCSRVTIAQIDAPAEKNLSLLASQVLGSLDDHATDGCLTWGVYGLAAEVPADFELSTSRLLSGCIQLLFTRRGTLLFLDRWGPADVLLRRESLEDWLRARYFKALKRFSFSVEPAEVRGHSGVMLSGKVNGIRDRLRARALEAVGQKSIGGLRQYAWVCEETNRICSVALHHSRGDEDTADDVTASFVCHN